jgi:hypothetical protein
MLVPAGMLISGPALFAQNRTVRLNEDAFAYAKELIAQGRVVVDKKNGWRSHHPMTEEENEFIRVHGFAEYSKWHLGIDETHAEDTKARSKFPFGDFNNLHRCGLLAVKSRAHQFGYADIEKAAIRLIEIVNSKEENQSRRREERLLIRRHTDLQSVYPAKLHPTEENAPCQRRVRYRLRSAQSECLCSNQEAQLLKNPSINSGRSSL